MSKRKELMTTKALVKTILEQDEKARNCDNYLYLTVLKSIGAKKSIDISGVPVSEFLMHSSDWGFPPFETVRRTRQYIQRKFPGLSACETVQDFRKENEAVFKDFARGAV